MEPQGGGDRRTIGRDGGGTSPALRTRLRRIRYLSMTCALAVAAISAVVTLWLSNRIVSEKVSDAANGALRDTKDIAKIVERMFAELEAIPQVLATGRAVREVVRRFNQREPAFAQMTQEQRRAYLTKDPEAVRLSKRLTQLRDNLRYDLLYVLDAKGIRIATADWDGDPELLGFELSDRKYFTEAMALRNAHEFAISRTTRKPVLFFSAPIEEEEKSIGAVVVRQASEVIGANLAGGQDVKLIVDSAGMAVATSHPEFYLRHIATADRAHLSGATKVNEAPDAGTLRSVYAEQSLRAIPLQRPARSSAIDLPAHDAERIIDGRQYLVTSDPLQAYAGYSLFVFTPIDWVGETRRLHFVVGALFALFCALAILYAGRGASGLARQRHDAQITAALNEKLTAANVEKDRYLGIAAHDLRNPLSSMRGLSELMLEAPLEPEQQREFLETIHRTSDEMLGLVNDLLDVSVIESGKLTLRRADHDVAKLIQQRIRHLEAHARGKKIGLTVDAPGVQRASIDSARFGQVIDNLVSNAIKFSPSGTAVRVALQSENGSFAFSVQDQGPGIPEADRKLLFRSFQKLSARPTGGEKSTGLGLAIVKKIVDAHGGTIDVESGSGGGTRFTVTAPSAPAREA
jgi:signal transduction histidine kinase